MYVGDVGLCASRTECVDDDPAPTFYVVFTDDSMSVHLICCVPTSAEIHYNRKWLPRFY